MQLLEKVLLKFGHSLGLPSNYTLLKKLGAVRVLLIDSKNAMLSAVLLLQPSYQPALPSY